MRTKSKCCAKVKAGQKKEVKFYFTGIYKYSEREYRAVSNGLVVRVEESRDQKLANVGKYFTPYP